MEELNTVKSLRHSIEQHQQAEIKKGLKFIGSQTLKRNHILWEFNLDTGGLNRAEIELETVVFDGSSVTRKKVKTKENCQYFGAMNRRNAIKKLKSIGLWKN